MKITKDTDLAAVCFLGAGLILLASLVWSLFELAKFWGYVAKVM